MKPIDESIGDSISRRQLLKGAASFAATAALPSAVLSSLPSRALAATPTSESDHFTVFGGPRDYAQKWEQDLEDLAGFLGYPFYGRITVNVENVSGPPRTIPNCIPVITMPTSRMRNNGEPTIHESNRAIQVDFHPMWNRGLSVVTQKVLRPNLATYPTFGKELHSLVENSLPSDIGNGDLPHYITDGSFVGFVIEKYGIERVMSFFSMIRYDRGKEIGLLRKEQIAFGTNYNNLVKEWKETIRDNPNRNPLSITPRKLIQRHDDKILDQYKDLPIILGEKSNLSPSGRKMMRNDVVEAFDFVKSTLEGGAPNGYRAFKYSKVAMDASSDAFARGPLNVRSLLKEETVEISWSCRTALTDHYDLVSALALSFIGYDPNHLANMMGREYLALKKPTLGGLTSMAMPHYGLDIDAVAKAYLDQFEPLQNFRRTNYGTEQARARWTALEKEAIPYIQAASFGKWVAENKEHGNAGRFARKCQAIVSNRMTYETAFGASLDVLEQGWQSHLRKL